MPMARTKGETPNQTNRNPTENEKKRQLKRGTAKKGSCLFPCFCVCFAVSGKKEVKYKHSTKYRQQQLLFAFMNNGALLKTGRHGRNI